MRRNFKDMTGQKFVRLTVMSRAANDRTGCAMWICLCDCGTERTVLGASLRTGNTQSCGCLQIESVIEVCKNKATHKMTQSPEYRAWSKIKERCYNQNIERYPNYGGRGIKVCDRWLNSFENFLEDMGEKPSPKHSIDRKDNDGDYTPDNCRWATGNQQQRNTTKTVYIEYNGLKLPMSDWAESIGIGVKTLAYRIKKRWPAEKALMTPVKPRLGINKEVLPCQY